MFQGMMAGAGLGLSVATTGGSTEESTDNTTRQTRVHELIQQMQSLNVDNDGNNLADFKPLSHPIVNTKKTEGGGDPAGTGGGMGGFDNLPTYVPPANPRFTPQVSQRPTFSANNLNLDKNSDYRAAYQPPPQIPKYTGGTGGPLPKNDDRLMDKINYMIHLLEEQANEKTNNVLEEFVMFSLVGVFLIYVLDSFSRSGRYVR